MGAPRKANVIIQYNGKNITTKLSEFLTSFSYIDVASGESDSISLKLSDINKQWINKWMPTKGDTMSAVITTANWMKDGDKASFKCGSFIIDEYNFSGRPMNANIGAVSVPATEAFKSTKRSKSWKSITVESIAKEIAKRANISLSYEAGTIQIGEIEQNEQTDCEYLYSLCESYGLAMKVYSNKIIIFDEAIYEKKKSVVTIHESDMLSWSYQSTLTRTYTGAELTYTDADNDKDIVVKVGSGNRILKLNEKSDSIKDAELKAIAKVNAANRKMTTMKITIMANSKIVASSNVTVKGLGKLDGKYAVDKVKHSVGNGYTMQLELRLIQTRIGDEPKFVEGEKYYSASSSSGMTYKVQRGDTLWSISKHYLGSGAKYMTIYQANKDVIEAAAKTAGKVSSDNGYYIWPGTILTIP